MPGGRRAALTLLASPHAAPTAIVAANDLMAFGVIETARALNINVPGELSVAGFDDLPTAADRCPSLTTVRQPVATMAEHGAKILLRSLEEHEISSEHLTMEVSLTVRESTGVPCIRRNDPSLT